MVAPERELEAELRPRSGLLTNSSALLSSRLVVAVLGWAGTILIVRRLDADEFGRFAFVFSLIGLLSFATDLSSSRVMVRALAQPDADRASLAGAYVCLRALLGVATYGVAVAFVVLAGYPSDVVVATALAGLGLIIGAVGGALTAVFQAEVRLGHVAIADVVGQLAQLALTVAVALTQPSLLLFVLPALFFDVTVLGWKAVFVRRLVVPRLSFQPRLWGSVLRQAAPLAVGTALFTLSAQIPLVLLSKLDSFAAVGLYGVAVKFVMLAAFLPRALTAPLLPLLVRSWPQDVERFWQTVRRALLVLAVAGGALICAFVPVADDLIAFLYGEEYREAGVAAAVTVAAVCATFSTQVAITVLITVGKNRQYILLGSLSLLATVGITVALVPTLSYEGAAVGSASARLLVLVVLAGVALRTVHRRQLPAGRLAAVAGCTLAGTGIGYLVAEVAPWPVASAAAVLTYVAIVEATRAAGPRGLRSLTGDGRR